VADLAGGLDRSLYTASMNIAVVHGPVSDP
jgi:hypothetical protein